MSKVQATRSVPALKVNQWLPEWNSVRFEPVPPRAKPDPQFFLFSMSAYDLKRLTGIYRRDPNKKPAEDFGIQRRHIKKKSDEILRYIHDGFPLSKINKSKLVDSTEVDSLRMPGWLSSAIIVNILGPEDERGSKQSTVRPEDLVTVQSAADNATATVEIPKHCLSDDWEPNIHPMEVIDGQHRLWALEESNADQLELWTSDFKAAVRTLEIPVVAFVGLDRTWQAYLFYTINQLPKKVDTSLAYDLYPLLRHQDWLDRFEGPEVYRQTRAQDLTIRLWSNPESPWKHRISRIGREKGKVSQGAFVRALVASFIKRYTPQGRGKIGGLFGNSPREHDLVLQWSREQQAAFLILIWQAVEAAITETEASWAKHLRESAPEDENTQDRRRWAFVSPLSLLTTDQGVRCVLQVFNDLFWLAYDHDNSLLDGYDWAPDVEHDDEDESVRSALQTLRDQCPDAVDLADELAQSMATFDWRTSKALSREEDQAAYDRQATYRGSSGYRAMRKNSLAHLITKGIGRVPDLARGAIEQLGFEETGQ